MLISYARVSTQSQDNAAQITALKYAGCAIFEEKVSGGLEISPLSRSLKDVLTLMKKFQHADAGF